MPSNNGVVRPTKFVPKKMPDATLTQNNPVSTTLYEVLPLTSNVRIYSISVAVTWAVTQPTPLEVVLTVDNQTIIYIVGNPVSAQQYAAATQDGASEASQALSVTWFGEYRAFLMEGRQVRVQVRVTWAVTQPDPLFCRVKYAKW